MYVEYVYVRVCDCVSVCVCGLCVCERVCLSVYSECVYVKECDCVYVECAYWRECDCVYVECVYVGECHRVCLCGEDGSGGSYIVCCLLYTSDAADES